jgi:hypothetical protein
MRCSSSLFVSNNLNSTTRIFLNSLFLTSSIIYFSIFFYVLLIVTNNERHLKLFQMFSRRRSWLWITLHHWYVLFSHQNFRFLLSFYFFILYHSQFFPLNLISLFILHYYCQIIINQLHYSCFCSSDE